MMVIIFIICSYFSDMDDQLEVVDNQGDDDKKRLQMIKIGAGLYVHHFIKYNFKEKCRTSSLSGYKWVMEVLHGHYIVCHEQFRMEISVFIKLCDTLHQSYGLEKGKDISIHESVAIFFVGVRACMWK
ncbi:hypothetical protein Dsin_021489 [Dipteronia sinensis]|uniref:DUF8040 domain-containing protein n=1 Tax=Dipteronia sinensis TaxID=43782 RepID=A0AAE0A0A6_9ROSI|nr:hypothetical protein Dsin_021489 [Dipteronia sinensis]